MKQTVRMLRGLALVAPVAVLCLMAGTAQAQRGGRSTRAASATGGSSTQFATSTGGQGGGCMSGSGSSSSTSGSTGTTTTGSSTGVTSQSVSTGAITAQRVAANSAIVRYTGSTSNVQAVYLAVLNANGNVISQRMVSQGALQANLGLNNSARYYGAMVVYTDGTSRTAYAPIR